MLTTVNCYLLWGFTWLQFLTTFFSFSYRGRNLSFYTVSGDPLGFTIPEMFFGFSVALAVYAVCAVVGGTWRTPRLWKRILAVGLFVIIAIGASITNLHLRHYSYNQALEWREDLEEDCRRYLRIYNNTGEAWALESLEWERRMLRVHVADIRIYEDKYKLDRTKPNKSE